MPKANFGAVAARARQVRDFPFTLAGVEFVIYLQEPDLPVLLAINDQADALAEEHRRTGNWIPAVPPIPPSLSLFRTICALEAMQCGPGGAVLADEDRYSGHDFALMCQRLGTKFQELGAVAGELMTLAEQSAGNS